ncbi:MAG: hypothetical protein J5486_10435 [Bacteroidaceae bacterium]|nr:hypothetical protein [Bacteroidaceae bacterium]
MRKQNLAKMLCGVLIGTAALSACVDDKYDLGNLDGTVQLGQGSRFSLPTSDVDSIKLSNLFDIDPESSIEERADGSYFVNTDGKADPTTVKVNVIEISKPDDQHFDATLDLRDIGAGVKASAPLMGDGTPSGYFYDISSIAKADIKNARATGISSDVVAIDMIKFTPTTFNLDVTVTGTNIDVFKSMTFDHLVLHLPKGFGLSSCSYMGNELLTDDLKKSVLATGQLDIYSRMQALGISTEYTGFKTGNPISFRLVIDSTAVLTTTAASNGATFNPVAHSAALEGKIQLEGFVSITNTQVDETLLQSRFTSMASTMTPAEIASISADISAGNYQTALAKVIPQIDFKGDGAFGSNLSVTKFTGKIQHSINSINPVELNDLPDFLTEDGVSLDLANPQIFLQLTLKSPIGYKPFRQKLTTSVQLDAYQKGNYAATGTANTGDIEFNFADATHYLHVDAADAEDGKNMDAMLIRVCNKNKEGVVPAAVIPDELDYLKNCRTDAPVKDLNTLLTTVPDRIEVKGGTSNNIVVNVDCDDAELPLNTTIDFAYTVYTPLEFGETFTIVYTDSEDGWAEDMKDLEDLDFESIEISATAVSKDPVPLDMNITANAIAVDGSVIPELIINTVKIPASSKSTPITLTIKPKAGKKMRDFFRGENGVKKLDGIKYKATMDNATKGAALKSSQYIILDKMKITLVGGITYYDKD